MTEVQPVPIISGKHLPKNISLLLLIRFFAIAQNDKIPLYICVETIAHAI